MGNIVYDFADNGFNTEYVAKSIVKALNEKYNREFEIVKIGERYGTGFTNEVTALCTIKNFHSFIFRVIYNMVDEKIVNDNFFIRCTCFFIEKEINNILRNVDSIVRVEISKKNELDKVYKTIDFLKQYEDEILHWKIVDIHDTTTQNGFYGCVIETSDDNAIVGIRGSEGFDNYPGLIYDWIQADFGLLNNEDTNQTLETERYAKSLAEEHILDKYKTVDVCGHSLGGNLSSHFAVICASNRNTETVYNKLNNIISFDGPGVSDEYLNKHKTAIDKVSSKITHYKWSPIGNLLYNFPGEKEVFLKTRKYYGDGGIKEKLSYYTFWKHDPRSIIFDKEGNAERGEQGAFEKGLKKVSLGFEQIPNITTAVYTLAASTIGKMIYQKDDGKIGFKLPFIKRPADDYRNVPTTYQNFKIKCGHLTNGVVEYVKNFYDKVPTIQMNDRYVLER